MKLENLEEAKKLFFDYSCNRFYMSRDGMDIKYKELGGIELEREWYQEYLNYWLSQLSVDDMEAVDKLHHSYAVEALPDLIRMTENGDGYSKLWYANAIWDIAMSLKRAQGICEEAVNTSIQIWETLAKGDFHLTDEHVKIIIPRLIPAYAKTPEKYIVEYAKSKLSEAEKRLSGMSN